MVVVGADAHLSPAQLSSVAASTPGRLSIAGYASLMDEASARETMPSMSGFRYGVVDGYCRIFNLVSIVNIRKGLATGRRLATCTARPRPGSQLRVCCFDIPREELQPVRVIEDLVPAEGIVHVCRPLDAQQLPTDAQNRLIRVLVLPLPSGLDPACELGQLRVAGCWSGVHKCG